MDTFLSIVETSVTLISTLLVLIKVIQAFVKGSSKEDVMRILTTLVKEAEEDWGAGQGDVKFTQAVSKLYSVLPSVIQTAYTLKDIQGMITVILERDKIGTQH